jgi:DNA ligase-1
VTPSDSRWIKSDSELTNYYKEVLKKGGEGLILKNPKSLYQWRRSKSWLKMKPVETFDLRIVEVLRGSGKFSTTCGSLHLKGSDENGKKIDTNMGSGLSDADRNFFWKNRESVKGKTIEVECQEMTKAKNADVWSLRFPVYLRMRADK